MISSDYERCINCKHCRRLKELNDSMWEWSCICTVFLKDKDGWALYLGDSVAGEYDRCEMWEERE